MNKSKPNNPLLTKEELVNLLEKKSGEVVDFNELDEFEIEAFEGFSVNSSPHEAQKMIGDMDLLLSQKLTTLNSPTENAKKKRGYVWFTLAASLALIIGLSILFFKKNDVISEQNMALNNVVEKELQEEMPSVLEQPSFESSTINKAPLALKDKADSGPIKNTQPEINTTINLAKSEEEDDLKDRVATGSAYLSNTNADEIMLEQDVVADSKLKKENVSREKNSSVSGNQSTSSSPVAANYSKYDIDEAKNMPSADKEADVSFTETKALTKKSIANEVLKTKESINTLNTIAIYKTGINDIKKFVLDYEKNKPFTQKLKGSYDVKATIKTDGKLIVNEITSTDKANTMYVDYLKQALNAMNEWNPTFKNGKAIESTTNFKLDF